MLAASLLAIGCGPADESMGVLEFAVEGTSYRVEHVTLSVRANPRVYEGSQFKTINRGEEHVFGYFLARPAATESPDYVVDVQWLLLTADPDDGLSGLIRTAGADGKAMVLTLLITLPEIYISNELRGDHTAWVAVDAIGNGRARGRFGGRVSAVRPDEEAGVITGLVEIEQGTFDVPFQRLFQFAEGD